MKYSTEQVAALKAARQNNPDIAEFTDAVRHVFPSAKLARLESAEITVGEVWPEGVSGAEYRAGFYIEDSDSHPFKDFTIKAGKRSGQRFMCALAEIGDDEQPVRQEQRNSQLAYLWCNDPDFLFWAKANDAGEARERMLKACGVNSRGQLDTGDAAVAFEQKIKKPYIKWRSEKNAVSL